LDFKQIRTAVARQFQAMASSQLFWADVSKDKLWETYLASFPAGSNPAYKTRTEHDCYSCRSFIRTLGAVVTIVDGSLVSIWDTDITSGPYREVCRAMSELVKSRAIQNIFLHTETIAGVASSRQLLEDKSVLTWTHFHANLPPACVTKDPGPRLSDARTTHDVFLRALEELTIDSIETVLELISQNSLYRGEEHTFVLESFLKLKKPYMALPDAQKQDWYAWGSLHLPQSVTRIRNTAIGTLLVDLSAGVELDTAVKSFEMKVAPTNYKRPTALVTKAMIQKAQATLTELGLTSALERRYAVLEDITANNILWADRTTKKVMNVFEELSSQVAENPKNFTRLEEIGIEEFVTKLLPKANSLEVMVENRHAGNFVSLIAPCDPTARGLFKWPNSFSWSYAGEVADSIKERVKRSGGSVTGDLCCRLAWDYSDDLDFHMMEPSGTHIYYQNRRKLSACGGMLDIDANGADGIQSQPVENIFYADKRKMTPGVYQLRVYNYRRRSEGVGFQVEIEFDGQIRTFTYEKAVRGNAFIDVATIKRTAEGFEIIESLPSTQSSRQVWGIPTQTFQKANVVMLSPNHWDERSVGNKHYFFMLEGCANDGKTRGFYNEFLSESLAPHRKVFEVVGAKMKTDEASRQLSGVGFSSTQRNSILCRVGANFTRTVKVTF
jgi:hypothetical protein